MGGWFPAKALAVTQITEIYVQILNRVRKEAILSLSKSSLISLLFFDFEDKKS
ncbi:MAG: hypothetical protein GX152_12375 [Methanosarcina sp.]|jgi:hypothetical protein|nr:hypothetical protein [Methanosarcina sp.]NLN44910.1 hypothetical protein [Methanosarcina sp.]